MPGEINRLTYQGGTEEDYQSIYKRVAEHLNSNQRVWRDVAGMARCTMTPEQFKEELEAWIRWHLQQPDFFKSPVKHLRGGRFAFVSWLKKPWAQKKYNPTERVKEQQATRTSAIRRTIKATA